MTKGAATVKGKVHRTVVRPAALFGLENEERGRVEAAELRISAGVTRKDRIRQNRGRKSSG